MCLDSVSRTVMDYGNQLFMFSIYPDFDFKTKKCRIKFKRLKTITNIVFHVNPIILVKLKYVIYYILYDITK